MVYLLLAGCIHKYPGTDQAKGTGTANHQECQYISAYITPKTTHIPLLLFIWLTVSCLAIVSEKLAH